MLHSQRFIFSIFAICFLLFALCQTALGQTPPKYLLEITRTDIVYEPPASTVVTPSVILLASDNGSFIYNQSVSGQGMYLNTAYSDVTDSIALYVKGQPNGNIPWRLQRNYFGALGGGNITSGYQGIASFPLINRSWQSSYDFTDLSIPLWIYSPPISSPTSKTLLIDHTYATTGTTNNTSRSFSAYPGTNYYRVWLQTLASQQRRRYSGGSFVANGTDPYSFVNVDYLLQAAISTLVPRKREPGDTPGPERGYSCPGAGSGGTGGGISGAAPGGGAYDELVEISLNIASGNVHVIANDPVPTRGYPLRNRIHLNSQVVETTRSMANATFTYDIHVTTQSLPPSGGGSPASHWILVDGDGQRLNFGLASGAPTPEPGVFSTLTQTMSGFELTDAGPPEEIRRAGNFKYEFDSNGNLIEITDPAGNEQVLTYSSGKLINVLDVNSNKEIDYTYTGSRITQVTQNGGGADTFITYTSDRVTKLELKQSGTVNFTLEFTYDGSARLATIKRDGDANSVYTIGYTTQTSLEPSATVNLASLSWPTGATHVAYNLDSPSYSTRTSVDNSEGGINSYDFDSSWNLKSVTMPSVTGASQPVVYSYTYDSDRNMITASDGTVTRTFDYAANGILTKITNPGGYYKEFNYSGANLTSVEDSIDTLLTLSYTNGSLPNHPTEIEDALGNVWTYTYNAYGQITDITPPTGSPTGATTLAYDESSSSSPTYGWLESITDGEGNVQTLDSYSSLGDVTSYSTYVDPGNPATQKTTTFTYDAGHRLKVTTHPDSASTTNSYSGGKLAYTDDEAAKRTNFTWCADCGAPAGITKPLSWGISWKRDADQSVTKFVDAMSNATSYTYGKAKELVGISYPDGTTEDYSYDNYARLDTVTNGRGEDIEYSYDSVGRVDGIDFPTSSDPSIAITYRGDSLPDDVTDGAGTTSYEYDSNRRLEAVEYDYNSSGLTNVQRVEYTYNNDNSLATITWKDGASTVAIWTYGYDLSGRMISVDSFSETTSYTYDGQDKILTQTNANGTETTYTYNDDRGWPTEILHEEGVNTIAEYDLTYDGGSDTVGNLTRVDETVSNYVTYTYNDLHRLTGETRTGGGSFSNTFVYDLAGNLTTLNSSAFATYDSGNKIASIPSGSISNDNDGNITAVTGAGLSATTLSWDSRSKLTSQTNSSVTTDYGYDADGRRVWSEVVGSDRKFYIFAGDTLVGEIEGSSQLPTAAYTWGANGLVSERRVQDSETYWYHFGPQGETRNLTDDTGSVVNTYAYDAYGKTLSNSGSVVNPYKYGGRFGYYSDGTAGMMLAGARWYSPHLKRWVSRDPIKYRGGYNLSSYVSQNPVGFVDPDGLIDSAVVGGASSVASAGAGVGITSGIGVGIRGIIGGGGAAIGVVGAGIAGAITGDCIVNGIDDCAALVRGMCASNSKPSLDEQADALKQLCWTIYDARLQRCYFDDNPNKCVEKARKRYRACLDRAEEMRPTINDDD